MNYYKVISNGKVIDANCIFLKWQSKHRILIGCDAAEAQFILSYDQEKVWHVAWLNPVPVDAGEYETIEAVEITEEEYLEIRSQLDDGSEIIDPDEPDNTPPDDPDEPDEPAEETVMSTDEMRRIIAEQAAQLSEQEDRMEMLEACILEMSEIVYDE